MTDAPTPVVLDDQGSSPAAIPTQVVTASGDGWKGPGEKPHDYFPDLVAMGDCLICGHTYEAHRKPVENSPSPALGGYEAQRSEHKDHPTPVGDLEPVAWLKPPSDRFDWARASARRKIGEPLVRQADHQATVSTLQAEIERLRGMLLEARPFVADDTEATCEIADRIDQALRLP